MSATKYTKSHEWIKIEGETGTVGITDYAQQQLGDVVFVGLPEVGKQAVAGSEIAVIESVKAASEIYSPVSGEVVAVNDVLNDSPDKVNTDPMGEGWLFKIKIADKLQISALTDENEYFDYLKDLD